VGKPNPLSSAEFGEESTIATGGKARNRKTFLATLRTPLLRLGYEILLQYSV
jgi:hypothetical protein